MTATTEEKEKMKAVVYKRYGSPEVLETEYIDKPIPGDEEILIRTHATTVTFADTMMRRGDTAMSRILLGLCRPKKRYRIMGLEVAGEVVQTGSKVTRWKKGDAVFGFTGFSVGAYAQYCRLNQGSALAIIPDQVTYEEAVALVDGSTTAMFFLFSKAKIKRGERGLIIGASGSVGTAAVQLAKGAGAHVTAVCSKENEELVKSLGADSVIDYTKQDFSKNGEVYDFIFDAVGTSSFHDCRRSLAANGRYLTTVFGLKVVFQTIWTRLFGKKKCIFGMSIKKDREMRLVRELLAARKIKPVIDRRYTLKQIVDAHRYVDTGHKKGNVVVTVAH